MSALAGALRRWVLGIRPEETSFVRRGFEGGTAAARAHLESIARTFVVGYHAALASDAPAGLVRTLEAIEASRRGFAYEGAAMALALLDGLTPWNRQRFAAFLTGGAQPHLYLVHAGLGWALARLPGRIERRLQRLDPLLRWLAMDGYGFHDGFFHWPSCQRGHVPARLKGYARRAFDQGLGRCLWFIHGAEARRLGATLAGFPASRQPDLWSGVGLAAVYAGGVEEEALRELRAAAGGAYPCLAQGAVFAAKARLHAGWVGEHARLACQVLCELSVETAAQWADETGLNLPPDGAEPAYEAWRRRLQARFE